LVVATSPQAVANAFVRLAGEQGRKLTNMQLQKLVFFAQAYALALLDKCLYEKNIHAWQWGPVIPTLYKSLQKYGSGFVTEEIETSDSVAADSEAEGVIRGVWEAYGMYTGAQLSEITHRPGSPWVRAWERKPFSIIDVGEIKDYYQDLVSKV
jgi:uncharacterized phage-associated protein